MIFVWSGRKDKVAKVISNNRLENVFLLTQKRYLEKNQGPFDLDN